MKILLTGANGQVGWEIARRAGRHDILALDRAGLDIVDAEAVRRVAWENRPAVVINAAAYTAVDRAEQEPEQAFAVNRDGPAHLAASCARQGIPLLHISTDYVFDGKQNRPYREDDPTSPLGVYGRSKWEGEEAIRRIHAGHVILRASWVFGEHGNNFVKTILRLARERDALRVVADQRGCPTYAGAIAVALLTIAERMAAGRDDWAGTVHFCGAPATTWWDFAQAIVARARAYTPLRAREITPITTQDYPTPAQRPAYSILACDRLQQHYGLAPPDWRDGLDSTLRALLA